MDYINWVGATQEDKQKIALILNGDVIDTLAENQDTGYIAINNAVTLVKRIMNDDQTFKPIWAALAAFVQVPHRRLIILLGNHDIEMAFPPVQQAIVQRLTAGDESAQGRIEFSTAGAGYTCRVGKSKVFCSHGNEEDEWNFIRYEDLSKAARRLNAGKPLTVADWQPNAGTKLVKDVMNDIKRQYAWIDLLKPETQAALSVLAALAPEQLQKITTVLPIVGQKTIDSFEVKKRLSADGFSQPTNPPHIPTDLLLGENFLKAIQPTATASRDKADQMLLEAEKTFNDLSLDARAEATLGLFDGINSFVDKLKQLISDKLTINKVELLRTALKDWLLTNDKSFKVDDSTSDPLFKPLTSTVGSDIDFIVTGHTHLERAIKFDTHRYYFNSGTWIRLLQFTPQMLKDDTSFKEVYDVLMKGDMASIDAFKPNNQPFVLDYCSSVCIKTVNNETVGQLLHVKNEFPPQPFVQFP